MNTHPAMLPCEKKRCTLHIASGNKTVVSLDKFNGYWYKAMQEVTRGCVSHSIDSLYRFGNPFHLRYQGNQEMIMQRKYQKKSVVLVSSMAIALGLATMSSLSVAGELGYTVDSAGKIVKNSFGECWKSKDGKKARLPECGDAPMDTDGDGVADDKDSCKGTPAGVKVDSKGCALDSDADGVADYKDKCPGTPAGAKVDARGCPVDTDGDGVMDYRDKCPGSKAGARVDARGCELISNIVIDSVRAGFDSDSAVIKPEMKATLDKIAADIKASAGNETLLVAGYTDSAGSDAYNKALSLRRARAVADYLASQGIDAGRMVVKGMGEADPVADNRTAEGRAKNRRVVIRAQ